VRRYVFSELTPLDQLLAPATLALLAERDIQPYVAITPPIRGRASEVVDRCRQAGVAIGIWPMIEDSRGRWASAWNGTAFADYTRALVDELAAADLTPDELLVDFELPIELTRRLLRGRPGVQGPPPRVGARALRQLVDELDRGGLAVTAAVHPWAVAGAGARGWQRALGTPIDGLRFRRVFAMAYTSLIEGYSRRLLARRDAEALLAAWVAGVCDRLGRAAGVAVGAVGVGALGDERRYRSPDELARDVAIARAAGAEHVALFDIGGVLDRPPAAAWLDAFVTDGRAVAPATVRSRLLLGTTSATGQLFDRLLSRR
jgi:hypothetical protein